MSACLDVRDAHALGAWLDVGVRRFGPVDLAVSNAAILGTRGPLVGASADEAGDVIATNVTGALLFARAVLPHLRRPGGVLMNVSSYVGRHALPEYGAYSVSKFAVEGLARLVAAEHGSEGIISVALDPGMIATEMLTAAMRGATPDGARSPEAAAAALLDLVGGLRATDNGTSVSFS